MTIRDRLRGALRQDADPPVDADRLVARFEQQRRFVEAATGAVDEDQLAAARTLLDVAGERLALSREHTVVVLAGATGGGKSSLFNAVAGADLSTAGVRRPTTGQASAVVWGGEARALLDWLMVPPARRHLPHGDPAADGDLSGLVLLDLPDFDSVVSAHRAEADRLLGLADLIVWVLDPQKYADSVVHQRYLRTFHRLREVTVVDLNQADRLSPADAERCLADLRRLLEADGLAGVPVLASSTVAEPGTTALRTELGRAVAARRAYLRRLGTDLDTATGELAPLFGPPVADRAVDGNTVRALTHALAGSAGVSAVAAATGQAYRYRARRATGAPMLRWLGRLRPDPLRRLHLDTPGAVTEATSVPAATPAALSQAALAMRALADRAAAGLPDPWPRVVLDAARSRQDDLPDALDTAVARTDLGLTRPRAWWWLVGTLQWLATAATLGGAAWLAVRGAALWLGLPEPAMPHAGRLPLPTVLLIGGVAFGLLVTLLARPLVAVGARRAQERARNRLVDAVGLVAREYTIEPVRTILDRYMSARDALEAARR
jgi:energy-coupling factor transporter ATP-binding protein EcfA2